VDHTQRRSEIETRADFSIIRYAQCWEDADIMLEALDVQPGDVCLSIGSGGENSLSLLTRAPARVIVVDLSPVQMACIELKIAAYRHLSHAELLQLLGSTGSDQRRALYDRIRNDLSPAAQRFWDTHRTAIDAGVGAAGKFEAYFALFRRYVLPLIHTRARVDALFVPRSPVSRRRFYDETWNTWRWRALCHLFFSRLSMGLLGRDPSFFKYVEGGVARRVMAQVEHAFVDLDPSENPYLQWIAHGRHTTALPHALRPENFEPIRAHLSRLELRVAPIERVLAEAGDHGIDRFNMSDIFEYVSETEADRMFGEIVRAGRRGGRVAYWNMLAPRRRPARLAERLRTLDDLGRRLHDQAKACFYSAFFVDEIT
jgi:S-adenosylmethionine-diacylglycerol 3-amino-3-carboxypropyl transferase